MLLTLAASGGRAEAQVYFLQGEQGPAGEPALACGPTTCTLDRDLAVGGALATDELTVATAFSLAQCPDGYERDATVTDIVLCVNGLDEMVQVGDFWVDRYEASVWSAPDCTGTQYGDSDDWGTVAATFPEDGNFSVPLHACSVAGVRPAVWLNYFIAQAACAGSGKHLVTNAEWQLAVTGTVDPGSSDGSAGECLTAGAVWEPRVTGLGTGCVSFWGAEDLIGSANELVAEWYQAGPHWASTDGAMTRPWPAWFGDGSDVTYNLDGRGHSGAGFVDGIPAALLRGGDAAGGVRAGAFYLSMGAAPSVRNRLTGFRCGRSR